MTLWKLLSHSQKEGIAVGLIFILVYRLGEAQLAKLASPFMLDNPRQGDWDLPLPTLALYTVLQGPLRLYLEASSAE